MQLGRKISVKTVAKWNKALAPKLLPGEEVFAFVRANNLRPMTDVIVVTNFRLAGVSAVSGLTVSFPYETPFSVDFDEKKETVKVAVAPGDWSGQAPNEFGRSEMLFKMVSSQDHELLRASIDSAKAAFDLPTYSALMGDQVSSANAAAARNAAAAAGNWPPETRVAGGRLSKKASLAVLRQCHGENDNPWLILVSQGGAGLLAAWDDRLAIIKTGAMTSLMAGSLGGERSAVFHFVDITGVEYNSGFVNGVLEVLTPSYSGGANKDFWRGTTSGRNADSNDPWTLSNTLPLSKADYNLMQTDIAEVRSRIAKAKQPRIIVQDAPAPKQAAPSIASQIAELVALRDAGALTEEEFGEAKRRIISG